MLSSHPMSDLPAPITESSKKDAWRARLQAAREKALDGYSQMHDQLLTAGLTADDITDMVRVARLMFDASGLAARQQDEHEHLPMYNITILAGSSPVIQAERVEEPEVIEVPTREVPTREPEPEVKLLPPLQVDDLPDFNALFGLRDGAT